MVECDGLENRWTRKGLEGSNPSSSATKSQALLDLETTGNLSGEHSLYPNLSQSPNCLPQRSAKPPTQCGGLLPCSRSSDCSPEWNHNRWSIAGRTVSESFTDTLAPATLPP